MNLYFVPTRPAWLIAMWGPRVEWPFLENVWFWGIVAFKAIFWLLTLLALWLTLWARQLRKVNREASVEWGIAQVILMGLGRKKGHVQGSQVSGGHTTLIDGADSVVKKLGVLSWFESVRPGIISVAKGGKLSVTIRRPADTTHVNTMKLIFRTKGSVQEVYL